MIFRLLIIYNHDRMSSITRVLHTATWDYFTSHLPYHFSRSTKVVKEAIMTDIDELVQDLEFWMTSGDGAVGAAFFAMRRLFGILQGCFGILVCFNIISVFATASAVELTDKNLQTLANLRIDSWHYSAVQSDLDDRIELKFKILFDG